MLYNEEQTKKLFVEKNFSQRYNWNTYLLILKVRIHNANDHHKTNLFKRLMQYHCFIFFLNFIFSNVMGIRKNFKNMDLPILSSL